MKTSVETQNKIIELYNQDIPHRKIAKLTGVGVNTVLRCLKKHNIPLRGIGKYNRIRPELAQKVIEDFKNKLEVKNICENNGISYHIFKKIISNNGLVLPGSGRKRDFSDLEIKNILSMSDNKESLTKIAEIYNANWDTINNIVKTNNPNYIGKNIGPKHGLWKGGQYIDNKGYIQVKLYSDDKYFLMAHTSGYILQHRYNMAKHLGRPLTKTETVHHIDGNVQNNTIENLQLRNKRHGKGQCWKCKDCGSTNIESTDI